MFNEVTISADMSDDLTTSFPLLTHHISSSPSSPDMDLHLSSMEDFTTSSHHGPGEIMYAEAGSINYIKTLKKLSYSEFKKFKFGEGCPTPSDWLVIPNSGIGTKALKHIQQ